MNQFEIFTTLLNGGKLRHKAWTISDMFIYLDDDGFVYDSYDERFTMTINDERWELAPRQTMVSEEKVRDVLRKFVGIEEAIDAIFEEIDE